MHLVGVAEVRGTASHYLDTSWRTMADREAFKEMQKFPGNDYGSSRLVDTLGRAIPIRNTQWLLAKSSCTALRGKGQERDRLQEDW